MEVVELVDGYYTVICDTSEKDAIADLADAWGEKGVDVITLILVRAIEDAVDVLSRAGKPRKGKKHADKG